jgi:hypothetical protein
MHHQERVGRMAVILAAAAALVLASAAPVHAQATETLPYTVAVDGTEWDLVNSGGIDAYNDAFVIEDAAMSNTDDAFDDAGLIVVDGEPYQAPDDEVVVEAAGGDVVVAAGAQTLAGLDVSVQHRFFGGGQRARILASFTNGGGGPVTVPVLYLTDYGSDGSTTIEHTNRGDEAELFDGDRWAVSTDLCCSDPVITTVIQGPGTVASPSDVIFSHGQESDHPDYHDELHVRYDITVEPGDTVFLMWFFDLYDYDGEGDFDDAIDAAIAVAQEQFDSPVAEGLYAGIAQEDRTQILNWAVPVDEQPPPPTTTTTTTPSAPTTPPTTVPPGTPEAPRAPVAQPAVAQPTFTG